MLLDSVHDNLATYCSDESLRLTEYETELNALLNDKAFLLDQLNVIDQDIFLVSFFNLHKWDNLNVICCNKLFIQFKF